MVYASGEDRSSWQRVSGWAGDAFGFAKATEGTSFTDPDFAANWLGLAEADIIRGAYHFFHPAQDPVAQAEFFTSTVARNGTGPGDIYIADVELLSGGDGTEFPGTTMTVARKHLPFMKGAPGAAVGESALAFLEAVVTRVSQACPVLVYSSLSMARSDLGLCAGYPLFVADYTSGAPTNVAPWKAWTFWQHEGGGGPGGGDADYFNGTDAQLARWLTSYADYDWTETLVDNLPTLSEGDVDPSTGTWYVRRAQNEVAGYGRWNNLGHVTAVADDGKFGVGTKAAVEAVQRHAGISVDGRVGPQTWTVLIAG
jgi:hypothetical protein